MMMIQLLRECTVLVYLDDVWDGLAAVSVVVCVQSFVCSHLLCRPNVLLQLYTVHPCRWLLVTLPW